MIHAVCMAGGKGTRFWPLSRAKKPKQFLDIIGDKSLLALTLDRLDALVPPENRWIVSNVFQKEHVIADKGNIPESHILLEPYGKNTAPCIAWAALEIQKMDPESVMIVFPADHYIPDSSAFVNCLSKAVAHAQAYDRLVLIGITPTSPHTGYGYIETESQNGIDPVISFKEKPDLSTAEQYVLSNRFLWNSGIFVWKVKTILNLIQTYTPEIATAFQSLKTVSSKSCLNYEALIQESYSKTPSISIDYGVLEKAANQIDVMKADFAWSDIGNWPALDAFWPKDNDQNAVSANIVAINSQNNMVYSQKRLISLIDVSNMIIIDSEDALLIMPRSSDQRVRQLYDQLPVEYQ